MLEEKWYLLQHRPGNLFVNQGYLHRGNFFGMPNQFQTFAMFIQHCRNNRGHTVKETEHSPIMGTGVQKIPNSASKISSDGLVG